MEAQHQHDSNRRGKALPRFVGYGARKAIIGSTAVARRAGTNAAAIETNARIAATPPKTSGSLALTSYNWNANTLPVPSAPIPPSTIPARTSTPDVGVQIYHWNGTSWGAPTPAATLYADAGLHGVVADHFAGPTWRSNSGGTVVGTVLNRCTPDAASIPWLSLSGVADGPGIFQHVTFIQRLHTVGGNPPATVGTVIGEERRVPYTANYLFYKAP